jgi:hypothetical protein
VGTIGMNLKMKGHDELLYVYFVKNGIVVPNQEKLLKVG